MKTNRKGVALITALVVMAVLAVVLTVVTVQIVAQRNLLRNRERQLQADWLARAGVELAAARLLDSPKEFSEEKRDLAPAGKVKIDVKKSADDVYVVSAEAEVSLPDEKAVIRSAGVRFRRTDSGGVIRLQLMRDPNMPQQ
jgi:type II secretory pathway component PulK